MKAAVVGGNGQLGADLCLALSAAGHEVLALNHTDVEIGSVDSVTQVIRQARPDAIINTAALHHVERCESDPLLAYTVNALGPRNLAIAAEETGAILVQISTDYVFDGSKRDPYLESDNPAPLNVYGNTKLAGEHYVRGIAGRSFVLRTSALYGHAPCRGKGGLNFVELMLKLAAEREEIRVVNDEFVSPTWTMELARQIATLLRTDAYGVFHATAESSCSWYDFATEIFRLTGTRVKLSVALPNTFFAKTPRPKYSVLENERLKVTGLNHFRDWPRGLREYLGARVMASRTPRR